MVANATSVLNPDEVRAHFARHVMDSPARDCRVCAARPAPTRSVAVEELLDHGGGTPRF